MGVSYEASVLFLGGLNAYENVPVYLACIARMRQPFIGLENQVRLAAQAQIGPEWGRPLDSARSHYNDLGRGAFSLRGW